MNRKEYLQWSKLRALQLLEAGEIQEAYSSMASDLQNHEDLANHPGIMVGMMLLMNGGLKTKEQMKKFIEDFN